MFIPPISQPVVRAFSTKAEPKPLPPAVAGALRTRILRAHPGVVAEEDLWALATQRLPGTIWPDFLHTLSDLRREGFAQPTECCGWRYCDPRPDPFAPGRAPGINPQP